MDRIERRREHIRTVSIHEDVYSMVEVNIFKLYKNFNYSFYKSFYFCIIFTSHLNRKLAFKIKKKKKSHI